VTASGVGSGVLLGILLIEGLQGRKAGRAGRMNARAERREDEQPKTLIPFACGQTAVKREGKTEDETEPDQASANLLEVAQILELGAPKCGVCGRALVEF
jgi:hypothetical protein